MAHSFMIFDFGTNEDAAQQARHRIDGWKQGFRLDKKLQMKFDRKGRESELVEVSAAQPEPAKPTTGGKAKKGAKSKSEGGSAPKGGSEAAESTDIRLIVRLDFSDHEKLSHQRWLDRIPSEEPFKDASPKIVRSGEPDFQATSELFDSLD